jgi:branched-subunit amino acid permease
MWNDTFETTERLAAIPFGMVIVNKSHNNGKYLHVSQKTCYVGLHQRITTFLVVLYSLSGQLSKQPFLMTNLDLLFELFDEN